MAQQDQPAASDVVSGDTFMRNIQGAAFSSADSRPPALQHPAPVLPPLRPGGAPSMTCQGEAIDDDDDDDDDDDTCPPAPTTTLAPAPKRRKSSTSGSPIFTEGVNQDAEEGAYKCRVCQRLCRRLPGVKGDKSCFLAQRCKEHLHTKVPDRHNPDDPTAWEMFCTHCGSMKGRHHFVDGRKTCMRKPGSTGTVKQGKRRGVSAAATGHHDNSSSSSALAAGASSRPARKARQARSTAAGGEHTSSTEQPSQPTSPERSTADAGGAGSLFPGQQMPGRSSAVSIAAQVAAVAGTSPWPPLTPDAVALVQRQLAAQQQQQQHYQPPQQQQHLHPPTMPIITTGTATPVRQAPVCASSVARMLAGSAQPLLPAAPSHLPRLADHLPWPLRLPSAALGGHLLGDGGGGAAATGVAMDDDGVSPQELAQQLFGGEAHTLAHPAEGQGTSNHGLDIAGSALPLAAGRLWPAEAGTGVWSGPGAVGAHQHFESVVSMAQAAPLDVMRGQPAGGEPPSSPAGAVVAVVVHHHAGGNRLAGAKQQPVDGLAQRVAPAENAQAAVHGVLLAPPAALPP